MRFESNILRLLQIFADGGDGGAGAGVGASAPAADAGQQTGVGAGAPAADAGQKKPTFRELIDGEYKKDYEKNVQEILRPRLKGMQDENKRLKSEGEAWNQVADLMRRRYGAEGQTMTPAEIAQAILADDYFVEREADKNGFSTETQREMIRRDWANADRDKQLAMYRQQEESRQYFQRITEEAKAIKEKYPEFDLEAELKNELFMERTKTWGVPALQVYEMMHHDEIVSRSSQSAAEAAAAATSAAVASGGKRPAENGLSGGNAVSTKFDPANMTDEHYRKIREAIARGETVGPGHSLWG